MLMSDTTPHTGRTREDTMEQADDEAGGPQGDEAGGPQGDDWAQADDARLRAEVDALLLDPRGRFRPRALALRDVGGVRECVVMQVGEDAAGGICVVTSEPLADAVAWTLDDGTRLRVEGVRAGDRPGDAQAPCWISVLRADA